MLYNAVNAKLGLGLKQNERNVEFSHEFFLQNASHYSELTIKFEWFGCLEARGRLRFLSIVHS